ncbi:MAG: sensor histidine kinase, partial [Bacteroidia bacterium]
MSTYKNDNRIESIFEQIIKFAKFDFNFRGTVSGEGDEVDAIIAGLNTLGEELNMRSLRRQSDETRMNALLDILIKYTTMDFSERAEISEQGDEIDAFAAGVNALVEELEYRMKALKESEERFRMLVENIKDYAIYMIDPDGYIITWNKGAEHIKGYSEKEAIGKNFSIFYIPEDLEEKIPEHNLMKARENGRYESQGWRIKKNGERFWADISITAIYDNSGQIKGFSKITHDITDRKNAEIKLEEKGQELLRSNSELEQFAYVASHDLQEPLRMVTSYVQLLERRYKDKLDENANEFIRYAVDGSNRMRTLINSLLEYSRVNRVQPFEEININKLLDDVLQNLADQIRENKAQIKYDKLPNIYGDPVLINQLFQNLISNAIKFRGKDDPEIIVACKKEYNEFLFSIKDNGIGIKKEYANKIFIIFQRLHSRAEYPGT